MSATESNCFYCSNTFSTTKKGLSRYNTHFNTHHCQFVEFRDKTSQQLLAVCNRSDPNSDITCYDLACTSPSYPTSQSLILHVNKVHLSSHSVTAKSIPFPSTVPTSLRPSTPDIDAQAADDEGSSTSSIAETPSENEGPSARGRIPRTLSSHRMNPYGRNILGSRSPSPSDRPHSPVYPPSPIQPSPLAQVAFSRPPTPSEHSTESKSDNDMVTSPESGILDKTPLLIIPATFRSDIPRYALVCTATGCGHAINPTPDKVIAHLHPHSITLTAHDKRKLKAYLETIKSTLVASQLGTEIPDRNSAPLPGLVEHNGYVCLICDHAATTPMSIQSHVSRNHSNSPGTYTEKSQPSTVQTFFNQLPRYFGVNSRMKGVATTSPYAAYLADIDPLLRTINTTGAPPEANDLSPLLQQTNWHVYFSDILPDKQKVKEVVALMKTPTSARGVPWLGKILKDVIFDYMVVVRGIAKNANIRVLRLLRECPRVAAGGEFWHAHDRDETLSNYGTLLHKWTHAMVVSVESPITGFDLPFSEDDLARLDSLKVALKAGRKKEAIEALHLLFKHIWYPRQHSTDQFDQVSKWNNIYECLIALHCLREDATFDQPANITQRFAKIEYHIRGCMLYEAFNKCSDFDNNLEKAVFAEASANIDPNIPSPYNNCVEYQALITSLAYRAGKAPTTRVSDDGMFINWKGHDFSVAAFRNALQVLADNIQTNIDTLISRYKISIQIPDTIRDDWNDNSRGYSWTTSSTFVDDARALLKAVLTDSTQTVASVDTTGKFKWNVDKCWDIIKLCDNISGDLALLSFFTIGPSSRGSEFLDGSYANGLRPRTMFHDRDGLWLITRRVKSETLTGQEAFIPKKCHPRLTHLFHQYLLIIRPLEAELMFSLRDATVYQQYKEFLFMRRGRRLDADTFSVMINQFLEKHLGTPIGLQGYRQVSVEMGRVFIGNEFLVDIEESDTLAAQSGHSARVAQGHYAVEASHLPGVSSEEILRFGYMSELWWWMTGFLPNHPPLLPRRVRFKLTDTLTSLDKVFNALPDIQHPSTASVPLPTTVATSSNAVGITLADLQGLIDGLKATISHEVQQINTNLNERVRSAVAEALSDGLIARPTGTGATLSSVPPPPIRPTTSSLPPLHIPSASIGPSVYSEEANAGFDDMYGNEATDTTQDLGFLPPPVPTSQPPPPSLPLNLVPPSKATPSFIPPPSSALPFAMSPFDPRPVETLPPATLAMPTHEEHLYMLGLLQQHFPLIEKPRFKSEHQLLTVYHTLRRKQSFISVMPTNAGKSLVMTLPPFHERGYQSYVVIPNKALLTDQLRNARQHNLTVEQWSARSKKLSPGVDLAFMALESATSLTFRNFWAMQEHKALRVVTDEAHQVLTEVEFRTNFEKLRLLANFGVQLVFLTASLPPRLVHAFCVALSLPLSTPIIRAPSDQPNISFNRVFYNARLTKELRLATDIALYLNTLMDPDQIGIIFCTDKTQARLLQEGFTYCASYSTLPIDDKARFENMWMKWSPNNIDSGGKPLPGRWIAATTTLIHGINAKNVGATIFLGMPFGMLNFYQGSGRGGRDGRNSYSILLDATDRHLLTNPKDDDWSCVQEGITWLERDECRRLGFSRLLDNKEVTCFDLDNAHMCDFCNDDTTLIDHLKSIIQEPSEEIPMEEMAFFDEGEDFAMADVDFTGVPGLEGEVIIPRSMRPIRRHHQPSAFDIENTQIAEMMAFPSIPPPSLARPTNTTASLQIQTFAADRRHMLEKKAEKATLIAGVADSLQGYCVVCYLKSGEQKRSHSGQVFGKGCGFGYNPWMLGWIDLKKQLIFPRYDYCYRCQLPQDDAFRPASHPRPPDCPMNEFVIQTLWFALNTEWDIVRSRFPTAPAMDQVSRPDLVHWLKQSSGEDGFWNGLEVVMWYLRHKGLYSS